METLEIRYRSSKLSYSIRSPVSSPHKCLPLPKRQRRMRTGIEGASRNVHDQSVSSRTVTQREFQHQTLSQKPTLTIKDLQRSTKEGEVIEELTQMSTEYILQKVVSSEHNKMLVDLQTYYSLSNHLPTPERSNIIYFKVLDQRCDDKETLINIISELYEEFVVLKKNKWVLLEGDQATYQRLQCIKAEYGNDLAWMIPFPGDWHFLKKF